MLRLHSHSHFIMQRRVSRRVLEAVTPASSYQLSPPLDLQEIAEAAAEAPLSAVGKVGFEAGTRGGVLLFVHGVAIKFEQAVRRASQMKVNLNLVVFWTGVRVCRNECSIPPCLELMRQADSCRVILQLLMMSWHCRIAAAARYGDPDLTQNLTLTFT